jgi:hypothetical protein
MPHDHFLRVQAGNHLLHEGLCGLLRHLRSEFEGHSEIHAEVCQKTGAFIGSGQIESAGIFAQNSSRVGEKGQHDGRAMGLPGFVHKPANDRLVAKVYAIKCPDGYAGFAQKY